MNKLKESEFSRSSDYDKLIDKTSKKVDDNRFGKIILIKLKESNKQIFLKEKICGNKKDAEIEILDLKNKIKITDPNILRLLDYSTYLDHGLCSSNFVIKSYFEYPENDLEQEIKIRKENKKEFKIEELILILKQASYGLKYLQENDFYHGDIRPSNISCDFLDYHFKIINLLNTNNIPLEIQRNNFSKLKTKLYMSPEIYYNIRNRVKEENFDKYKCESFSLGLVMLEAALLEDVQDIYGNRTDKAINVEILHKFIDKLENKFGSENIINVVVSGLLDLKESERPDLNDLYHGIINYEKQLSMDGDENYESNVDTNINININNNKNERPNIIEDYKDTYEYIEKYNSNLDQNNKLDNYQKQISKYINTSEVVENDNNYQYKYFKKVDSINVNNIKENTYQKPINKPEPVTKIIKKESINNINSTNPTVSQKSISKVTIVRYRLDENGNKILMGEPKVLDKDDKEMDKILDEENNRSNNNVVVKQNLKELEPEKILSKLYSQHSHREDNYNNDELKKNSERIIKINKYKIDKDGNKIYIEDNYNNNDANYDNNDNLISDNVEVNQIKL